MWRIYRYNSCATTSFNPHTHEGCDVIRLLLLLRRKRFQSTHPRRVWLTLDTSKRLTLWFQSTHPRRVWHSVAYHSTYVDPFQSTHPRRVWRIRFTKKTTNKGFNPHTHEGCDLCVPLMHLCLCSFNPHTHEGCDYDFKGYRRQHASFNPHTHEGCDLCWVKEFSRFLCFNPHTHEGCDLIFSV